MKKRKKISTPSTLEEHGIHVQVLGVATYRNGKPGTFLIVQFDDIDDQSTRIMMPSSSVTNLMTLKKILLENRFPYDIPSEAWELVRKELVQKTTDRMLLVETTGFYDGVYLRSDNKIIGTLPESKCRPILDPSCNISLIPVESKGTLKEWKQNVASAALHSSRIMLALSCSFSAYILHIAGVENGGINLYTVSSKGKTTCLEVAISVSNSPAEIEGWSMTEKGAEEVAFSHNDKLLTLDELGTVDKDPVRAAQTAGKLAYVLTYGKEKRRSNNYSSSRNAWRIVYLSSSEKSLTESATDAGVKRMLGEEIRLVDVPADAGFGIGVYESIPQGFTPSEYADHLKANCSLYYGVAERVFLKKLTSEMKVDLDRLKGEVHASIQEFLDYNAVDRKNGSEVRRAKRFALAYAGARLAVKYGVVPFDEASVMAGVSVCYKDTMAGLRDRSSAEIIEVETATVGLLKELKIKDNFLDISYAGHGKSADEIKSASRFVATYKGKKVRAMLPASFDELIPDSKIRKAVLKRLKKTGRLLLDANGRSTIQLRSHLKSTPVLPRCYCFLPKSSISNKLDS